MFQQKLSTFLRPQVYRVGKWFGQSAVHLEAGFSQPLQRCLLCGSGEARRDALCKGCLDDLPRIRTPCMICGGNVGSARLLHPTLTPLNAPGLICGQCLRNPPVFDRARSALEYEFPVDEFIRSIKYRAALHWIPPLTTAALPQLDVLLEEFNAEQVRLIPVPLHKSKARQRGFNQATAIARALSVPRHLTVETRLLYRAKATRPQAALAPESRRENMKEAFVVDQRRLQHLSRNKGVNTFVLIDDVMTTGATADECARAFRAADPDVTILAFSLARKSQC